MGLKHGKNDLSSWLLKATEVDTKVLVVEFEFTEVVVVGSTYQRSVVHKHESA